MSEKVLRRLYEEQHERIAQSIENAKAQGFEVGVTVKVKGEGRVGRVVGYNKKDYSAWDGERFPVVVRLDPSPGKPAWQTASENAYGVDELLIIRDSSEDTSYEHAAA
jgi:hypothetical protein